MAGGVAVAVLVLVAALFPAVAGAAQGSDFCKRRLAVDYAAPLAGMPGVRPLPEGELPFGPRNFSVYPIGHLLGRPHVVLAGTNLGYTFAGKNYGQRVLDLGWRFEATAVVVDRDGKVLRKIGTRGWHVTKIKELNKLQVAFPARHPGFVRVDVQISTLGGRSLGKYRDYFRVLKPTDDVRLAIEDASVHPGERVVGLMENHGTVSLSVRTSYFEVEHLSGGVWSTVPQPPTPQSIAGYGSFLTPGENGRCYGYTVPADAAPGRYRFSASTYIASLKRKETVTGAFEVTS